MLRIIFASVKRDLWSARNEAKIDKDLSWTTSSQMDDSVASLSSLMITLLSMFSIAPHSYSHVESFHAKVIKQLHSYHVIFCTFGHKPNLHTPLEMPYRPTLKKDGQNPNATADVVYSLRIDIVLQRSSLVPAKQWMFNQYRISSQTDWPNLSKLLSSSQTTLIAPPFPRFTLHNPPRY